MYNAFKAIKRVQKHRILYLVGTRERVNDDLGKVRIYNTFSNEVVILANATIKDDQTAKPEPRMGHFTSKGCWGPWR